MGKMAALAKKVSGGVAGGIGGLAGGNGLEAV